MNFKKNFSDEYLNTFTKKEVYSNFVCSSYRPLSKKEHFLYRLRRAFSYLTRYQIVDTWHIHDGCE